MSAAADVLSASIYNRLGTRLEFTGIPAKVGARAIVGGLIAEAASVPVPLRPVRMKPSSLRSATRSLWGDMHDQLLAMTSQLIDLCGPWHGPLGARQDDRAPAETARR
ncbi:hypothetical protein [Pseudomonas sp. FP2309]|uniref:hypothetical protein n=1 Tax=Pseudomonas sp. FP2309 TaxID=2954091 RepID=UPI00273436A6|nr:hypothetical protein [Pseudomonas sp. FP2309]WLH71037.1 hypothetical protein PSH59_12935 [Pseudomonas sp. FP2309]